MGIFNVAAGVARRLPLGEVPARAIELVGDAAERTENEFYKFLRTKLEANIAPVAQTGRQLTWAVTANPRDMMAGLLERSVMQDAASSKLDWFTSVLSQLVPDEARIIAALADGPPVPLLHVLAARRRRAHPRERFADRAHGGADPAEHDAGCTSRTCGPRARGHRPRGR